MCKRLLSGLSVALLTTTLGGCFQFGSTASPGLPAHLPRECQRILVKVPDPGAKEDQDMSDIAANYRAAWLKGNNRIASARNCDNKQADAVDRGAK